MTELNIFLDAFSGKNERPPVWFMRQAGRYLPEYQVLKSKYDFWEMTENPEIASQITLMPVDILGVDAAILFKDILTLPKAMGFNIDFVAHTGPVIRNPLEMGAFARQWPTFQNLHLEPMIQTIQLTKKLLPSHIPLIGFAGSPFTVLCYLIEGKGPRSFHKIFRWMHTHKDSFHHLLQSLTEYTIQYLKLQKSAGIDVFQIFDTWGGVLTQEEYTEFSLPFLAQIFAEVSLPSIHFIKQGQHLLPLFENLNSLDFVSVCHSVPLNTIQESLYQKKGIQGNLSPSYLYMNESLLEEHVEIILKESLKFPRYIFNLGHGLFQDTPVSSVKYVVSKIKALRQNLSGV